MRKLFLIVLLGISLHAGMFSQGRTAVGIKLGSAYIGDEKYTIAGLSGSHFLFDNFAVGGEYERWFTGSPTIQKLTINGTAFAPVSENIRPYGGLFYRRIFISDGYDDTNAYGYRLGLSFVEGNFLISAGMVQERYETYGEILIGFSF